MTVLQRSDLNRMEFLTLDRESFSRFQKEFADLYTLCFGVEMKDCEVAWRYLENPYRDILSCVAMDEGRLVANYSASPIELSYRGKPVKAALSLNTMTHPDYSGRGLFVKLAEQVYRRLYKTGYQMILGFPNNLSNRTFVGKLGWKDICIVPTLQLDLSRARPKSVPEGLTILEDDGFLLEYEPGAAPEEIAVYKTREYLRWRYAGHPANRYYTFAISGKREGVASSWAVIKEFRDRINLVDSCFADEGEMRLLLNRVLEFAALRQKSCVTTWARLGGWEHLTLESYGAILAAPIAYFGANVFGDLVTGDDFYSASAWRLNMSDDNVY